MPFQIADKPAIGAGLIGGALASNTKAGFLGAVIAAFIAGYIVKWGKEHIKLPDSMQQMMPLVFYHFSNWCRCYNYGSYSCDSTSLN